MIAKEQREREARVLYAEYFARNRGQVTGPQVGQVLDLPEWAGLSAGARNWWIDSADAARWMCEAAEYAIRETTGAWAVSGGSKQGSDDAEEATHV